MLSKYKKILTALGVAGALTTISTPAHAGFVAPIIAAVSAALGIGAVAATAVVVASAIVATAAVGYAIKSMTPSFDVPDYSANTADGAESVNTGILVNKTGTNKPIPVVYGRRKLGGNRVYVSTNGGDNQYLYIAMVFAEGEINAFKRLYLDDKLIAEGTLTTQINNSAYSNQSRLQYELQRGTTSQSPPSFFTSGAPGWSSNHRLRGLAVGYFKLRWIRPDIDDPAADQQEQADANPYGGIPKIQVEVEGKKTPNAASSAIASQTYANMTKAYVTDPASHLLDYLLNPVYGRGLDTNRIGFASFKTAAEKFATTVNYKTGGTGKMLEFNYVVGTNRTMLENVQTMLQNMRSGMPYIQGQFNLKLLDTGHASDPQNTTPAIAYAVTEREIIDGLTIEGKGHRDQYNQVKAVFPNPDTNWELDEVVYPEQDSQTDLNFLAEDNGRRLVKDISLEGVTNPNIAGDIASIVLLRSRKKKAISFVATAELHNTVVGDVISITYPSLGLSAAKFRITGHQITADYTIQITALEHESTDYDFTNTDVYIPKAVGVTSNDPNQNGGQIGPGNPVYPGIIDQNAFIATITNVNFFTCELTITGATDVSQYDGMRIDQIGSGASAPFNSTSFTSMTFLKSGNTFISQPSITVDNWQTQYVWFRIVYIKQDNTEVFGPWKRTANPRPIAVPMAQFP